MLKKFYQRKLIEAGVDEAGRGSLAGPVFAAAVVLPRNYQNELLNDSKKLTPEQRYALREIILRDAVAYSVAQVGEEEIDKINILRAAIKAMHLALDQLPQKAQFILVDGNRFYKYKNVPDKTIIKGDGIYMSIAAASILAKTYRDDFMISLHQKNPEYLWENNKGYGTPEHVDAIALHGYSVYHRKSFKIKSLTQTVLFED